MTNPEETKRQAVETFRDHVRKETKAGLDIWWDGMRVDSDNLDYLAANQAAALDRLLEPHRKVAADLLSDGSPDMAAIYLNEAEAVTREHFALYLAEIKRHAESELDRLDPYGLHPLEPKG
ncbi:hypothetical protein U0C82_16090 [Fulvimarina sp. 2208YS6-2-32]|uniref:Uncharacterized protein n=2 Tax=Fulvimarina uroteuthidis TaxID=3098149 RepID=A0ABU5I755_9HYPH|nr:hypothetical protein [Fulvimarina sp. 2208YS6-2-32]